VTDIFREVDEDVRRDRWLALWRRYRWLVIGGAVLIVVGTAAGVAWRDWQQARRYAQGERFQAAVALAESGRHEQAARAFSAFAEQAGARYAALARLREAAARAAAGDTAGAVALYDRLAADGAADTVLRELARVLAAEHLLEDGEIAEAERRLAPVAEGAGPWRHFARELEGVAALQAGRAEEARAVFSALAEEAGVPDGVKARAAELLAALGG
jgi:hypothetical protein